MKQAVDTESRHVGYEKDFYAWTQEQAALLRAGRFDFIDLTHLAEEVEDMGKRDRQALASNLVVILVHLLKYDYQPEARNNSWRASLREHRRRVRKQLQDSPSLNNVGVEILDECYEDARELAADETGMKRETFPEANPYDLDKVLDKEFVPQQR